MKTKLPTPQKLPSGIWRCQVMVDGKRVSVVDEDAAVAQAKAVSLKAGLLEQKKKPDSLTVGKAVERYIESKDAVLSPSTIRGYKSIHKNALGLIEAIPVQSLTQEIVQRYVNTIAKSYSPKYVANVHGLLSATLAVCRPEKSKSGPMSISSITPGMPCTITCAGCVIGTICRTTASTICSTQMLKPKTKNFYYPSMNINVSCFLLAIYWICKYHILLEPSDKSSGSR